MLNTVTSEKSEGWQYWLRPIRIYAQVAETMAG